MIGIDLAGTEKNAIELNSSVDKYASLFARAREAGLGTTIHTGETASTSAEGVIAVVERLRPDRIGHGIRAAYSETALKRLAETGTVLELCPTSNLHTRAVRHLEEFKFIIGVLSEAGVRFTINTDGTYLCSTSLQREFRLLEEAEILTEAESERARLLAFEASFIDR